MNQTINTLRELRRAAGLSLRQAEGKCGIPATVLGSWERGDRNPTVDKLDEALDHYGHELRAVPRGSTVLPPDGAEFVHTMTDVELLGSLRRVVDQLEQRAGR